MTCWLWVDPAVARAIHDEQLAQHGGAAGLRDEAALASAIARPQDLAAYAADADVAALAAAYAHGLARNHPFTDGNKRTALVVCELFLALNGRVLAASDAECVETFFALAAGALTEEALAAWVRGNLG
jgi:death-on-curing protein